MILSEKTNDRFGYDPSILSRGSAKSVVFLCDFCNSEFVSNLKTHKSNINACSKCRSLRAALKPGEDPRQKFLSQISNSKILKEFTCEFCNSEFTSADCNHLKGVISCKKCGSLAAFYSSKKLTCNKNEFYTNFKEKINDISHNLLNSQKTLEQFGYDPSSLNPYSSNKIYANCKFCSSDVIIPFKKYNIRLGNIVCSNKECITKKTRETLFDKYGVSCTLDIDFVKEKLADPKTEQIINSILNDRYKVEFIRNHIIGPYSFDFFIPSCNLLIECQGDYFHNFKEYGYSGTPKDRAKSSFIENQTNYKLVWIYEHELNIGRINKILDYHISSIIEPKININLNELTFKRITSKEAHSFLSQYHYLGNLGTVATSYGAFFNNELISVCVFGGVTRNQTIKKVNEYIKTNFGPKEVRELRRFCIKPNASIKNLASYSIKRFTEMCMNDFKNVKLFVSFSDQTVNDIGTIYKASNWKNIYDTSSSYHYLDPVNNKHIHKKTIWDSAKSNHMMESQFVSKTGLIKVNEMPKKVWIKTV